MWVKLIGYVPLTFGNIRHSPQPSLRLRGGEKKKRITIQLFPKKSYWLSHLECPTFHLFHMLKINKWLMSPKASSLSFLLQICLIMWYLFLVYDSIISYGIWVNFSNLTSCYTVTIRINSSGAPQIFAEWMWYCCIYLAHSSID